MNNMKFFPMILFLIVFSFSTKSQGNHGDTLYLKLRLLKELDKLDSCGIIPQFSMPAGIRDTNQKIISFKQYVIIENDSIKNLIFLNEQLIDVILIDILENMSKKYSYSANILLYYYHQVDGLYIPYNCDYWFQFKRKSSIEFWKQKLKK